MKSSSLAFAIIYCLLMASCSPGSKLITPAVQDKYYNEPDPPITQSLFSDRNATITEEGIQKILSGSYKLPSQPRVAILRIDNRPQQHYYWNDEEVLKTKQSYLSLFEEKFRQSSGVTIVSVIPELLISRAPTFTMIREAAVRMQADIVVVYSISSDLYSKYRFFTKSDIKAFATTQLIIMDVRTGLIPFSTIVTKDFIDQKRKEELDNSEARNRIQNTAVLLTIEEIGKKIEEFLAGK